MALGPIQVHSCRLLWALINELSHSLAALLHKPSLNKYNIKVHLRAVELAAEIHEKKKVFKDCVIIQMVVFV